MFPNRSGSKVLERGPATPRILPTKDMSNLNANIEALPNDDNDDGYVKDDFFKAIFTFYF
jgi:hypothetical protein